MTLIQPVRPRDPRCKGECKGDRAAYESPAVITQTPDGPRPACPCCGFTLTRTEGVEARPPNLSPELADTTIRFEDNICGYDVVFLSQVKAKE